MHLTKCYMTRVLQGCKFSCITLAWLQVNETSVAVDTSTLKTHDDNPGNQPNKNATMATKTTASASSGCRYMLLLLLPAAAACAFDGATPSASASLISSLSGPPAAAAAAVLLLLLLSALSGLGFGAAPKAPLNTFADVAFSSLISALSALSSRCICLSSGSLQGNRHNRPGFYRVTK